MAEKRAYAGQLDVRLVAETEEDAARALEVLARLCSGCGVVAEGGELREMAAAEVIADSPLAKLLAPG